MPEKQQFENPLCTFICSACAGSIKHKAPLQGVPPLQAFLDCERVKAAGIQKLPFFFQKIVISRKVLVASLVYLAAVAAVSWALAGSGKVHYLPYYLPCPETFSTKLHYTEEKPIQLFPQLFYLQPRALAPKHQDVLTVTPWLAPIVWEGTFDAEILDDADACRPLNLTMGVAAFAVGKQGQHSVCTQSLGQCPSSVGR
nr:LOW QUALITY PROTEIN: globoside alpha-1,3-N-acetylgalactosaminyltransferase 1 [Zonotrichia albicollis]